MFVLDTDHPSVLEWADNSATRRLLQRLSRISPEEATTTIITFEAHVCGWLAYLSRARTLGQQVEAYRRLKRHLDNYRSDCSTRFRSACGNRIPALAQEVSYPWAMDLKIAAIEKSVYDATLLSRNLTDFRKISGLKVGDWTLE